jgi:hypothetical protein
LNGGTATLAISALSAGAHSLTALYAGDANNGPGGSAALTHTVSPVATTTTLSSPANPAAYGQSVTLTSSVFPATATGTVTFMDGTAVLGIGILSNGTAVSPAQQTLTSGSHALTALYAGDTNNGVSTGLLTLQIAGQDAGCAAAVAPPLFVDSLGGQQALSVSVTPPSCSWTASTSSPWIQLSANGGTGNGVLTVTIAPNATGDPLTGAIVIGGQSIAVTSRATAQLFADVTPNSPYFDAVGMMYAKGITSGCATAPLIYCPTQDIPRWQMAVFIVRAVFGSDTFTSSATPYFNDVAPSDPGFRWIQKMYEQGITTGCGSGNFCPNSPVTRDQMSIFVIRMRYGAPSIFDFPAIPYFSDVNSAEFAWAWIQRLKEDGVTEGCALTLYCPSDDETRGDMATLVIVGAFNDLVPATDPVISTITPAVIFPGQTGTFTITGLNTNFLQGVTTVSPMAGITVGAATVTSPTTLTVQLTAAPNATLQPLSVQTITGLPPGNEEAVLPNGLTVP